MRSESNPLRTSTATGGSLLCVLGAAGLSAGIGLALNRAEDDLPSGAELALCFVGLPAEVPEWIELVPSGAVAGADGRAFVNDRPDEFIAQSRKLQRIKGCWAVDFDHQIQLATNPMAGGRAPAAGWISELENRKGSIWGKVEWTDLGLEAIQKKHYRGISPVFAFDKKSKRALGLLTAALTNNPNLDLVALNALQPSNRETNSMDWLKKQLGLAEDATEDAMKTAFNSFITLAGTLAAALGMDAKAALALNAETLGAALKQKFGASDVLVAVCTKAGLKADADADAIVAALQKAGVPDPTRYVPIEAHAALKVELDKLKADEPKKLVAWALQNKKIYPAQEEWALEYAGRDLEGFKKYAGVTPELFAQIARPSGAAADLDSTDAKAVARSAQAHIAEQAKLGITVSAAAAVAHVTKKKGA